jgi:hypothetical protein
MGSDKRYAINLDARYGPLEVVDVPALVEAGTDPWYNQTLCRVNDCVVRLHGLTRYDSAFAALMALLLMVSRCIPQGPPQACCRVRRRSA